MWTGNELRDYLVNNKKPFVWSNFCASILFTIGAVFVAVSTSPTWEYQP